MNHELKVEELDDGAFHVVCTCLFEATSYTQQTALDAVQAHARDVGGVRTKEHKQKLLVIVLVGVIVGMLLTVPTLFMSDIVLGGAITGLIAGVAGNFILKRKG